jgi:hypothetical protein
MPRDDSVPKACSGGVRTPSQTNLIGSGRCPVCRETELQSKQTACSAACRRQRSRQAETDRLAERLFTAIRGVVEDWRRRPSRRRHRCQRSWDREAARA